MSKKKDQEYPSDMDMLPAVEPMTMEELSELLKFLGSEESRTYNMLFDAKYIEPHIVPVIDTRDMRCFSIMLRPWFSADNVHLDYRDKAAVEHKTFFNYVKNYFITNKQEREDRNGKQ